MNQNQNHYVTMTNIDDNDTMDDIDVDILSSSDLLS